MHMCRLPIINFILQDGVALTDEYLFQNIAVSCHKKHRSTHKTFTYKSQQSEATSATSLT